MYDVPQGDTRSLEGCRISRSSPYEPEGSRVVVSAAKSTLAASSSVCASVCQINCEKCAAHIIKQFVCAGLMSIDFTIHCTAFQFSLVYEWV